jgi:hypothetical protein
VRRRTLAATLVLASACGGAQGPVGPDPTPTPAPVTTPGGTLQGAYVFRLEPAAGCPSPRSTLTFRVNATPQAGDRRPGVEVFQEGASLARVVDPDDFVKPLLEMEFLYDTPSLQGSIGTLTDDDPSWERESFVTSIEGDRVAIRGTAFATVTTAGGGIGEVEQGTLSADMVFYSPNSRPACSSTSHRWSLRRQ